MVITAQMNNNCNCVMGIFLKDFLQTLREISTFNDGSESEKVTKKKEIRKTIRSNDILNKKEIIQNNYYVQSRKHIEK